MGKYKVLEEELNINGIIHKKDTIIDLDFQKANLKSIQGKIEKVPDNAVPKDNSVLGAVVPGVPLTPEQKEKLAKENAEMSAEAHRMAADARAQDIAEGREKPTVAAVANALKEKLQKEEFEHTGGALPTDEVDPANLP